MTNAWLAVRFSFIALSTVLVLLTYSPGIPVPAAVSDARTQWVRARAEPAYGWFEPRLDASELEVPHRLLERGRAADVGRWKIPVRVDGKPTVLAGRFRYEPPPSGRYVSRLVSAPEVAPGVRVTLLPGPMPGLLVENSTARPLLILGADGEPFVRIESHGVQANVRSRTWRESARSRHLTTWDEAVGGTEWQRVAFGPRFSWIEPRAAYPEEPAKQNASSHRWTVPMRLGDESLEVTGIAAWKGAAPETVAPQTAQPQK